MNLSSGQKLIIAVVLIAVVAAAVFFALILPEYQKMASLDDDIAASEAEIDSARAQLEQRQAVKARSPQIEAELLALANELPENPEMPSLIIELQDTVNTSGMEFVSIQPREPEVRDGGYIAIPSEMVAVGTWQDCVDLLQRLRRITRQVRIVEFTTEVYEDPNATEESADTTTEVQVVILIEVYTMTDAADSSTAAPPAPSE